MDCRIWIGLLLGTMACQLYDGVPLHADTAQSPTASAVDALASETPGDAVGLYEDPPELGCSVEQCNGRDDDCDGRVDEEPATASCGADAAVSICLAGRCAIVRCLDDSRDCDSLAANGCEVKPSDPAHCGACGRACRLEHARSTCESDSCRIEACDPGFADCDGRGDNGCEASLRTHSDCGACGHGCADGENCTAGACQRPSEQASPPAQPDGTASTCAASPDDSVCQEDQCPEDPAKRAPGLCGCGVSDADADADGTPDCADACPSGAWTTGPCLPYTPLNLDPTRLDFVNAKPAVFNCGTTTLDTTASAPVLSNGCGVAAALHVDTRPDGTSLVVLTVRDLTVAAGSTLRLIGSRPVAIAAFGDVTVDGSIDAGANTSVGGAGSGLSCAASTGTDGAGNSSTGGGGGGGGGFGTAGGPGGTGDGARAGVGGVTRGDASLVPLRAGCPGGRGGGCSTFAAGGGAVQLSAAGRVTVKGSVRASGADGTRGCGSEGGGSGGGSGGGILIEAKAIEAAANALDVSGGRGGDSSGIGGSAGSATSQSGGAGQSHHANGGGGGGGGFGRIRLLLH